MEENKQIINQLEETTNLPRSSRRINRYLPKFNLATVNIIIAILFIVSSASYLVLSNLLISKGFELNKTKQQSEELQKENRDLELVVMKLESSEAISDRIDNLAMISTGDVEYVEIKSSDIAMR